MPSAASKHKTFNDDDDVEEDEVDIEEQVIGSSSSVKDTRLQASDGSDSDDDDDDDAPEALSTSLTKSKEEEKRREARVQAEQARAAKRKANRAREDKVKELKSLKRANKESASAASPSPKGKGRQLKEDEDEEEEFASKSGKESGDGVRPDSDPSSATTTTKDQISSRSTTSSTATRLDPSLFAQADDALASAKKAARLHQIKETAAAAQVAKEGGAARKRKVDFSDDEDDGPYHHQRTATKVIGNVTVQQLPDNDGINNLSASVDPSTALPSKQNETFVKKNLYKAKRNRPSRSAAANSGGKSGGKKESEFLLFDPLLDKKPENKNGKNKGKKPLNRIELEEQRRGRRNAQTAFIKSNPVAAKANLGFAVDKSALVHKKRQRQRG